MVFNCLSCWKFPAFYRSTGKVQVTEITFKLTPFYLSDSLNSVDFCSIYEKLHSFTLVRFHIIRLLSILLFVISIVIRDENNISYAGGPTRVCAHKVHYASCKSNCLLIVHEFPQRDKAMMLYYKHRFEIFRINFPN